jgi:hypothetical protein
MLTANLRATDQSWRRDRSARNIHKLFDEFRLVE